MEGRRRRCLPKIGVVFALLIALGRAGDRGVMHMPLLMPHVQPTVAETYLCSAFKLPRNDLEYIVEFTPNASMHVAHHILLYGCATPGLWERDSPRLVWDCGEMTQHKVGYLRGPVCSSGSQIVYAWAKDAPPLKLPPGVGFKVGKSTGIDYLVLQVHYANVDKFLNGGKDDSGVILTMLPSDTKKVSKIAGVFLVGTGGRIPSHKEEHMESACMINENIVLHPFAFRTHTHSLGKVVSGYKIDKNGNWKLIGKHNPQEPQMFYPVEDKNITIGYGDIVAARCTMINYRNRDTYIGSTNNDEMCNFYMMYYVEGDEPMQKKYCFSEGAPGYYWEADPQIGYIPPAVDKSASSLI